MSGEISLVSETSIAENQSAFAVVSGLVLKLPGCAVKFLCGHVQRIPFGHLAAVAAKEPNQP